MEFGFTSQASFLPFQLFVTSHGMIVWKKIISSTKLLKPRVSDYQKYGCIDPLFMAAIELFVMF